MWLSGKRLIKKRSNPTISSSFVSFAAEVNLKLTSGLMAKKSIAPPCHGGGRGFKSHWGRLK